MSAHTIEIPTTPWAAGRVDGREIPPELLFGQMYEDARIEERAFTKGSRVFAIASAGCTALALARRGDVVTAVDINPAQCEYVRARCRGRGAELGSIDRVLAAARGALRWIGLRKEDLDAFLSLEDPREQIRYWREHLDNFAWRTALACTLNPLTLRAAYSSEFIRALPPRFAVVFRERLERGFARHPNRTNAFAWRMLAGSNPPEYREIYQPEPCVRVICSDAANYLETCEPASFDAFTLSNILDGAPPQYSERLFKAMKRAAAPGARYVLRGLTEPASQQEASLATEDASMLWGLVRVGEVSAL
jgi:S-adenosylmethionine:diacylglycerol 3-amino-3-carboxypropyl transferase